MLERIFFLFSLCFISWRFVALLISMQEACMFNLTENKSLQSNLASLFNAALRVQTPLRSAWDPPRHHGWRLWFNNSHPHHPNSAVLLSDASQPVLTFSLFKHRWTLLAPDRGSAGLDNDMPYATLPLQLNEPCFDQLSHKSIWNAVWFP